MKPETIKIIKALLEADLQVKENDMMYAIVHEYKTMEAKIAEFRAAYKAAEDFDDWKNEQEE